ncbi:MAG: hypothetical protein H6955_06400 [Chromatiaceae bacterium]|nr:hypothetical protein [Chromatiaceae bacterium]
MIVEVVHPETGERYSVDIPSLSEEKLAAMKREYATDQQLKAHLDKLPLPAEVKAILHKIAKFSIEIGKTIIAIGKRVIEIALLVAKKFPNTTLGLIVGAILTALLALIPFIGPALSSIIGTLATIYATTRGFIDDLRSSNPQIVEEINEAVSVFRPLGATA